MMSDEEVAKFQAAEKIHNHKRSEAEIRSALSDLVRAANGRGTHSIFSVPPQKTDADIVLGDAIDGLAHERKTNQMSRDMINLQEEMIRELRARVAELERQLATSEDYRQAASLCEEVSGELYQRILDIENNVHEEAARSEAIVGHFDSWDTDFNGDPVLRAIDELKRHMDATILNLSNRVDRFPGVQQACEVHLAALRAKE